MEKLAVIKIRTDIGKNKAIKDGLKVHLFYLLCNRMRLLKRKELFYPFFQSLLSADED